MVVGLVLMWDRQDVGFGGGDNYFWVILVVKNWFVVEFSWWLVVVEFWKRRENCVVVTQRCGLAMLGLGTACVKMEYGDLREGEGRQQRFQFMWWYGYEDGV